MNLCYGLEVVMGLGLLMIVTTCIGSNAMPSLQDLASTMPETPLNPLVYFLAATLLIMFVIRSCTLLAAAARQLMAMGRYSTSKAMNFMDESDSSPNPRTALVVIAILTASAGALSLLKEYRTVFEYTRRLGALCTLTSHMVCIGSLLSHSRTDFSPLFDSAALFCCLWLFMCVNLPATRPVTWKNAPWSLAIYFGILIWLYVAYWRSARTNFLPETNPQVTQAATNQNEVQANAEASRSRFMSDVQDPSIIMEFGTNLEMSDFQNATMGVPATNSNEFGNAPPSSQEAGVPSVALSGTFRSVHNDFNPFSPKPVRDCTPQWLREP